MKISINPDVWPIEPITMRPEITLSDWQVFEVKLEHKHEKTRHFVGYSVGGNDGQVSSAITKFDAQKMRGVTESGRVYQLFGYPGWNADADHTWCRWKGLCGILEELNVTTLISDAPGKPLP